MNDSKALFVVGGSGFIGSALIREAMACGWNVRALARSNDAAARIRETGATAILGDANEPQSWIAHAEGTDAFVDLLQPARSGRMTRRDMRALSSERQRLTRGILEALASIDASARPRFISVSGVDDLAPDANGALSHASPVARNEYGFNSIGIPVRQLIESSSIEASFVYLGVVYGPGGAFGRDILPAVRSGSWKIFGGEAQRMLLVHVDDVVQGLLAIASLPPQEANGRTFVLTDDAPVAMRPFFDLAASALGAKPPAKVPAWMAALVAGKPVVETMLHETPARSDFGALGVRPRFPTYREGLPATVAALK